MNTLTLPVLIYSLAAAAALLVFPVAWKTLAHPAWLFSRTSRRLRQADTPETENSPQASIQSMERRLREAGLPFSTLQFRLASLGLGAIGILIAWWLFLPGLPAGMIGLLLGWAPYAWLDEHTRSRGLRLDQDLPLALSRIGAGLQAGRGLEIVLDTTAQSLPEESALAAELARTARDIRTGAADHAMRKLAERSASASLANLAMLLESYLRVGGAEYAAVVSESASQIQRIISVRNHARARAAQALEAARLIPLIMAGVLALMSQDPATAESFRDLLVQVVIVVAMGLMLTGYLMMRSEIRRVV